MLPRAFSNQISSQTAIPHLIAVVKRVQLEEVQKGKHLSICKCKLTISNHALQAAMHSGLVVLRIPSSIVQQSRA